MDQDLNGLADEMFHKFARFEYALKAAGFHGTDGSAEPDWHAFAKSLSPLLDNPADQRVREAVDYILSDPPKKQIVREGALTWSDAIPCTNSQTDRVLVYVRRIRNNLFHGGKFNGHWFEPERSRLLLRHGLTILDACLAASGPVRAAFGR